MAPSPERGDENDQRLTGKVVLKDDLYNRISSIRSFGSFATHGVIEPFMNPGISVDTLGLLRLPLSHQDAQALASVSRKAPFGKGSETLVDESIRKTWEIDANRVRFLNDDWQRCVDQMVAQVIRELGLVIESTSVRAEFYKMLLYEEGAMFKEHQEYVMQ